MHFAHANEVKKANYHTYKRFNQDRHYEKGLYSWFYQEIVLFTDFATNPAQRLVTKKTQTFNHSNKVDPLLSSSITFNLPERNSRVSEGVTNCLLKLAKKLFQSNILKFTKCTTRQVCKVKKAFSMFYVNLCSGTQPCVNASCQPVSVRHVLFSVGLKMFLHFLTNRYLPFQ